MTHALKTYPIARRNLRAEAYRHNPSERNLLRLQAVEDEARQSVPPTHRLVEDFKWRMEKL